ncbi:MAG: CDP-diacylglycerol--serine O-phosphatidyltransferase [bacterium]|nr:CDP-diacylglycerol--serine O-phosphatidyltransferase [bacterium]
MKKIYILPNLFTTASLFCGFLAITYIYHNKIDFALWAILGAIFFDGLDGKIARLTGTSSSFGMNYDSLSDLVSFGVAPGFLVYRLANSWHNKAALAASVLYVICAALRLARFNVQARTEESQVFVGLPSPAAAGLLLSAIMVYRSHEWLVIQRTLPIIAVLMACLMVSKIPYFNLKRAHLERRRPFNTLVMLVLITGLMIVFSDYYAILIFAFFAMYVGIGIAVYIRIPLWKIPMLQAYLPAKNLLPQPHGDRHPHLPLHPETTSSQITSPVSHGK